MVLSRLAFVVLFTALGSVAGCIVLPVPDWVLNPPGDDDDAGDDDDDDSTPVPECDAELAAQDVRPADGNWVVGTVLDFDGEPVFNMGLTFCGDLCLIDRTDACGRYVFESIPVDTYVIENMGPIDEDFASWSRFFDFHDADETTRLDLLDAPYYVPFVPDAEGFDLDGTVERTLGGGLQVSFDASQVRLPFGPESPALGAVEQPVERWPRAGMGDWTPLKVWALTIWELELDEEGGPRFDVTAPLDEPLDPGSEVAFLVAHYDTSITTGIFEVWDAELAADGLSISTPAGQGLERTTLWIAATRAPDPDPPTGG